MSKTAIIIGAGPAGLTAAYELLDKTDIKPIIFESLDCVGGISRTVRYKDMYLDVGPHHFFTKYEEIQRIWDRLLPEQGYLAKDDILLKRGKKLNQNGPDPESEDNVMLLRDRYTRIIYNGEFFSYPLSFDFQTVKKLGIIKSLYFGFGLVFAKTFKRKEESLEDYLVNSFGGPLYKSFFRDYTLKAWGVDPKLISNECGRQRINAISIKRIIIGLIKSLIKVKDHEGDINISINEVKTLRYPKYGAGQLWKTMAEKILAMGGEIHTSSPVIEISVIGNSAKGVKVMTNNGITAYEADYIISTMTINNLFKCLNNKDDIPKDVYESALKLPHRNLVTNVLLMDKLLISNDTKLKTVNNIMPDCWSYIYSKNFKATRFNIVNNFSPYLYNDWSNKVILGLEFICSDDDEIWKMTDKECINTAIFEAEELGLINKKDVIDGTTIKEKDAYPAYHGTYVNQALIKRYLASIKNLYTIGRKGQHNYIDMDQSMITALECVGDIVRSMPSKSEANCQLEAGEMPSLNEAGVKITKKARAFSYD